MENNFNNLLFIRRNYYFYYVINPVTKTIKRTPIVDLLLQS